MVKSKDTLFKTLFITFFGFIVNTLYGIDNAVIGIITNSQWLITLAGYYVIISMMRFSVLFYTVKSKKFDENETFIKKFSGYMFFILEIVLIFTTHLTIKQNIGRKYNEIIMITIALYTFIKIVFAIINLYKSQKSKSKILTVIRNISLADAFVSIFSLQRSMLVTFGEMRIEDIKIFNTLTGIGVCIAMAILGINLIKRV